MDVLFWTVAPVEGSEHDTMTLHLMSLDCALSAYTNAIH